MLKGLSRAVFPRFRSERGFTILGMGVAVYAAVPVLRDHQRQEDCCKFKASWATLAKLALKATTKQNADKQLSSKHNTKQTRKKENQNVAKQQTNKTQTNTLALNTTQNKQRKKKTKTLHLANCRDLLPPKGQSSTLASVCEQTSSPELQGGEQKET